MPKRDPERLRKLRAAVRYLLARDAFADGTQSRLAEHFHLTRQRVHQVVNEERQRRMLAERTSRGSEPAERSPSFGR